MELAMHCRDSGSTFRLQALYGSEWTVCVCLLVRTVAFLGSVRQQLLESGDKPRRKVAGLDQCYSLWCASLSPTEESRHMLFWAGLSLLSLFSTIVDCAQCT